LHDNFQQSKQLACNLNGGFMSRKNAAYTEAEIAKMKSMNKAGVSWPDIAKELNRSPKSLYIKFRTLKAENKNPAAVKIKRRKRRLAPELESVIAQAKPLPGRPMIALVGSASEVTETIRELFS
jgi:hypothetical protein